MKIARRGAAFADEVDRHAVAAVALHGEGAAGRHGDHRTEVADHADVGDARSVVEMAVVVGALDAVREARRLAEHLAGEAVEQLFGLRPAAVRRTEAETREGSRRIEIESEDRSDVAVQRTQDVAGLERQARRDGDSLVADGAIPLRDPAGEQHGLEARVELARQFHKRVGAEAVFRTVHDRGSLRRASAARQERPAPAAASGSARQILDAGLELAAPRVLRIHLQQDLERELRLGALLQAQVPLELLHPLLDALLPAMDLLEAADLVEQQRRPRAVGNGALELEDDVARRVPVPRLDLLLVLTLWAYTMMVARNFLGDSPMSAMAMDWTDDGVNELTGYDIKIRKP